MRRKQSYEDLLALQCKVSGLPKPEQEYRFLKERRWRFDLAWPSPLFRIAVEVNGGLFKPNSGHRSFAGVTRDYEKLNAAVLAGWRVLQVTPAQVKSGEALDLIEAAMQRRELGKQKAE